MMRRLCLRTYARFLRLRISITESDLMASETEFAWLQMQRRGALAADAMTLDRVEEEIKGLEPRPVRVGSTSTQESK